MLTIGRHCRVGKGVPGPFHFGHQRRGYCVCWRGQPRRPIVILNGESLAQGTLKAPVPIKVDPAVLLSPSGDLEFESRPTYAQVVAGMRAISHQLPAPSHGRARIEGTLSDKALFSGRPQVRTTEGTEAPLFIQPRSRPIKLVRSGRHLSPATVSSPLKGFLPSNVLKALSELEDCYSFGLPMGEQRLTLATETDVSGAG